MIKNVIQQRIKKIARLELNLKVVALLLHLIFLRKILARKNATIFIQNRCQ